MAALSSIHGACTVARRALAAAGARTPAVARALQTTGTAPYANFFVLLGASTSAAGAAAIVAAVQAAVATSSFPYTLAAWAPTWGFASASAWTQAGLGSPVTIADNVAISLAASYSPAPAAVAAAQQQQLTTQQQLGLGLGIGLSLAAIIVAVAACHMSSPLRCGSRVVAVPAARGSK